MEDPLLDALKKILFGKNAGVVDAEDQPVDETQLAQAALMFHVIAADGVVTRDESTRLEEILSREFDLNPTETRHLIEEARRADSEAIDLYSFTRTLKRDLDEEARLALIRKLWVMVYADGDVHEFEDNIVWRVAELLDIDARSRMELKSQVRGAEEDG